MTGNIMFSVSVSLVILTISAQTNAIYMRKEYKIPSQLYAIQQMLITCIISVSFMYKHLGAVYDTLSRPG